ncbi:MAG: phosphoesterase [Candidatus Angelobacter sp.]|nr:phosphoesterase [Candidatus Angelobacter sp.]
MLIKVPKVLKVPALLCMCVMFLALCSRAAVPAAGHVVVIVEENQSYSDVIGNSSMPYLNALARQYGLATQYYANTHPSIGNYFMMTTGKTTTADDRFNGTVSSDNIVRQLLSAGKTWKAYAESLPSPGYAGGDVYPYSRHHNPFTYFSDVVNSNVQRQNLVPMTQFANDLANGQLPNYSFVVPNLLHDGQDGTLSQADQWLKTNIEPLLKDPAFQQDGLLVIVFAESKASDTAHGGGHAAVVVIGPGVKQGYQSTAFYQHQSLLRTTLAALGVTSFPGAAANAADMGEMFGTQASTATAAMAAAAVTIGKVTITSPANGATVGSPVAFKATFSGTARYMKVWVDGVARAPVLNTGSLNTSLTLNAGPHQLVVEASDGVTVYKSAVNVTVSGGSSSPGGNVIANIQAMSGWRTCGACGNTGGGGAVASYVMIQNVTSPTLTGHAAKFSISGRPFTNAFWYHENPAINKTFSYLAYEFNIFIPRGFENSPQAIEFEVQQRINGRLYNFAWQALYPGNIWRTFDYATKSWKSSSVPYRRLTPGVWHHILAEYHTEGGVSVHDAITVDGLRTPVRIVHNSVATSGTELENAFQLDLNSSGAPVQVYVDNMKVTWR